ncbi:MFS transporter [Rhizobium gallicum]|uniref:MFS transporter n=1 Tax=Rhizobium gallicum TaxID=56730 RepID=UPI001C63FBAA|nr:MFS transporter [Rhizobium gallicum]
MGFGQQVIARRTERNFGQFRQNNAEKTILILHALAHLSQERWRLWLGRDRGFCRSAKEVEWFMVESWAKHLRQHKRVSQADADLQAKVLAYHSGPDRPVVRRFLAINRPGEA